MYLMVRRRISFLLSFLSGGWVGTSLRNSANAPLTFCWRQRSRLLVKTRRWILRTGGRWWSSAACGEWCGCGGLSHTTDPEGESKRCACNAALRRSRSTVKGCISPGGGGGPSRNGTGLRAKKGVKSGRGPPQRGPMNPGGCGGQSGGPRRGLLAQRELFTGCSLAGSEELKASATIGDALGLAEFSLSLSMSASVRRLFWSFLSSLLFASCSTLLRMLSFLLTTDVADLDRVLGMLTSSGDYKVEKGVLQFETSSRTAGESEFDWTKRIQGYQC